MTAPFLDALAAPGPLRAVELRPPRADLGPEAALDAWIDARHGVGKLLAAGRFVLFTDSAVGVREEESLRVLTSYVGTGGRLGQVLPFLTCRHSLEYCLLFARRAASHGFGGLTVTGGDAGAGRPRCLPRSRDLRARIRAEVPALPLGGWVNPFRDPVEQVELLMDPAHGADFWLTQVVSHHDLAPVDRFLEEAERRGLRTPGLFGTFLFRSARRATLERLARFLPVPVEEIVREFGAGATADEVLARTLAALRERGVEKVYVSNLAPARAEAVLRRLPGAPPTPRASPLSARHAP